MKEINQEQLLKLSKAIILGKIKYIGDDNNNGSNTKVKKIQDQVNI